ETWSDTASDFVLADLAADALASPPPKFTAAALPDRSGASDSSNADTPGRTPGAVWLGNWLSFYGPADRGLIHAALGFPPGALDAALDELVETGTLIDGDLTEGTGGAQLCDAENFERLLRVARRATRPAFEALPADALALFL